MTAFDIVRELINNNHGVIRTSDVMKAGLSRTTLSNLERKGLVERIARGQYILADSFPDELYLLQQRMSRLIFSHETALFLHNMAERTPDNYSATIPSNVRMSKGLSNYIKVYIIKPDLFKIGIVQLPTKIGHMVYSYDLERTVCDILRSRNRIDDQTVVAAVKNYAIKKDKDLVKLGQYATTFHVTKIIRQYFEVLL